jgi:hypothetical protein
MSGVVEWLPGRTRNLGSSHHPESRPLQGAERSSTNSAQCTVTSYSNSQLNSRAPRRRPIPGALGLRDVRKQRAIAPQGELAGGLCGAAVSPSRSEGRYFNTSMEITHR